MWKLAKILLQTWQPRNKKNSGNQKVNVNKTVMSQWESLHIIQQKVTENETDFERTELPVNSIIDFHQRHLQNTYS